MNDAQWARIEPLLPDRMPRQGGRWRDHRQVIDAIAFKYRTGTRAWTCLSGSGRGRAPTTGCGSGLPMAPGNGVSQPCLLRPTPKVTWTGSSRSTQPSSVPTSTLPGPVKRGPGRRVGRPCPRTVRRRTDHQDLPRRRQSLPTSGLRHHARTGR
ncbi:transposase [Streptomyces sp. ISL-87]|nr:transposase [Streptomyces sp. ISL-21]MBT2612041.1 transposase [Streptomyces sp. ISL-87]